MKGLPERTVVPKIPAGNSVDCKYKHPATVSSDQKSDNTKSSKTSLWSSIFVSTISLFETDSEASVHEKRISDTRTNGWSNALRRVVTGSSMKRLQERILGPSKTFISSSTSEIWLLGECYKASKETSSSDAGHGNGLDAFEKDFSSKIWMTYRKGFDVIGDSRFTSDVNWGCMLRSSQMLVAQALLFHCLGRSWRKPSQMPFDQEYIEILHLFGDSVASPFSIHNLLQAGKAYGLAAGSWVGPYATCRSWETLARSKIQQINIGRDDQSLSMATYVVSGDEDGERGGAPVVCIEDAARLCSEFSKGQLDWTPIILLVPLVLGLDKVNPRYIPLLWATFTFPQSLGIIGGKPGASTYIVGMQDDKAFYLDPHEVQPVVDIRENFEADTSSYHCSVIRQFPLDMIDPSLAIGFYCRDKGDFDDFCVRATKLAEESNGAPLFTVAQSIKLSKTMNPDVIVNEVGDNTGETGVDNFYDQENMNDSLTQQPPEDDWQLL